MKNLLISLFVLFFSITAFWGCGETKDDIVRIHIRANSNSECDQSIKLVVRDEVVDYITPLISGCVDAADVLDTLKLNLSGIEKVANNVLSSNGCEYVSKAKITNEYFPTREYGGVVFPADYYDAIIINLGNGEGNNWWCVAYPPLCFIGDEKTGYQVRYKSKLIELINKIIGA